MVLRMAEDPDVIRWGLHHLLQGATGYCAPHHPQPALTSDAPPEPHHPILHHAQAHANGAHDDVQIETIRQEDDAAVENDEIIAQTLQEEYAQISLHQESESGEPSLLTQQQWLHPPILHPTPSAPPEQQDEHVAESREPFSSCSSPGDDDDDHGCTIEFVDDLSALDGQVGKRLNDMVPVPHVPKTNGDIPSVDEAFSDHQRLLNRLVLYDLGELKMTGDGNCQFRALSDQFYRTPEHHRFVRQQVVIQLESYPEIYAGYVPMDYREYLKKMKKNGEWGDHVTLQAAADSYGVKIFILTSFRDTCYIEILPVVEKSQRVTCLSFWAEVHYNSIYPEGELPVVENKKKRWWHF